MQRGSANSLAAIFIFKSDEKNQVAWDDACELPQARVELHRTRTKFLEALRSWNGGVAEPDNAFLLIYAHGTSAGIAASANESIAWTELRAAIPRRIATIWLVGCVTGVVKNTWLTPADGPASASLLVTNATLNWLALVSLFRVEVSIDRIVFFDQMKSYLLQTAPELGAKVEYLQAAGPQWAPFAEREFSESSAGDVSVEDLQALWGVVRPDAGCGHLGASQGTQTTTMYRYSCSVCGSGVMSSRSDLGETVSRYCVSCSADFRDRKMAVREVASVVLSGCAECLRAWRG